MMGEADYERFKELTSDGFIDGSGYPLLRFSSPFAHWGPHTALEVLDRAIEDVNLEGPHSGQVLRKLHLLRAIIRQCLQHGFMAAGEPPAEAEAEPVEEEALCTSAVTTVAVATTELSESAELSESDTPSPFLPEDQSAESADER